MRMNHFHLAASTLFQQQGDPVAAGRALNNLGNLYRAQRLWRDAVRCCQRTPD